MDIQITHIGYEEIFDVCQVHLFKLNDIKQYATLFSLQSGENTKVNEYRKLIDEFSEPNRKLRIFFDMEYHKISFMSQYFLDYKDEMELCGLDEFVDAIRSDLAFKQKLISFYLGKTYETDRQVQYALMTERSEMPNAYKVMLYEFVNFYEEYIELLCESLKRISKEIKMVYQRSNLLLKRLQNKFDMSLLIENDRDISKWTNDRKTIYVSFTVSSPYVVMYGGKGAEEGWIILGADYVTLIEQDWKIQVSLVEICKALGDSMRMEVVREIMQFGEMSASTLAKKNRLSVKAMFYHLELLKNANVLSSRTKGRNTLYSINESACKKFLEKMKFLGGK